MSFSFYTYRSKAGILYPQELVNMVYIQVGEWRIDLRVPPEYEINHEEPWAEQLIACLQAWKARILWSTDEAAVDAILNWLLDENHQREIDRHWLNSRVQQLQQHMKDVTSKLVELQDYRERHEL